VDVEVAEALAQDVEEGSQEEVGAGRREDGVVVAI
jgi:hypothetical protein